ncbi:ROK family protein [bacterium]|nr:ROK family protein [bacterium]
MDSINVTLGIDIGGTNTVFGLVDRAGKCYVKDSIPTNAHEPAEKLLNRLFLRFDKIYNSMSDNYILRGIGIGAPNGNYYRGTVENPPNLSWGQVNFVELVKHYKNVPILLTNDANAAALGEMEFGVARGMKNFVLITLGTGLGSGIVVNGEVVYGYDGFAGEIGHIIVKENGRQCGCGRKGCLETYASATGLKRTVFEFISSLNVESSLRNISYKELSAEMVYDAAVANDSIALAAFEFTAEILGKALANTVAHLSPEAIILFGGLETAGDLFLKPLKYHLEDNLLNLYKNKVKILRSGLPKGDAAILGGSALIWNELDY